MGSLIDDLLKLSRVTRTELKPEEVNLSEMAQDIAQDLRHQEPERDAEFVVAAELRAQGDPRLLRIALQNLFDNAWKFTHGKTGARIVFGVVQSGEKPTYFVRDNGVGFDMTYADKLFGAFQRLHDTREFPGTGIGLATVQRVIHRHGGRIWAESAVDEGAAFYFTLS
jgi:light-regulated signal transduction histidine kinase (bacteriophytochrome)